MSKRIAIITNPEIEKRKKGYAVRFRIPAHNGIPVKKSKWRLYPGKTKSAARLLAEDYRKELEDSINEPNRLVDQTFGEYARWWHNERGAKGDVLSNTWDRDELDIQKIEASCLAHIDIQDLDSNDLENFKKENRSKKKGYSHDCQRKLLVKVKQILRYAEKHRQIIYNPSDVVDNIPRKIMDKRKALTREEQARLLSALESGEMNGKTTAVRIAFSTGFRRGEVLGLEWRDIDFENMVISIERQLLAKGIEGLPKHMSTGIFPMDASLASWLLKWKEITSEKWYDGKEVPKKSSVCRNANGKQLQASNFDRWRRDYFVNHGLGEYTRVYETRDKNGIKRIHRTGYRGYKLHELRHTFITEAVARSDVKTASALARHKNLATTAGYVHEIPELLRNAVDTISADREEGVRKLEEE